LSRKIAVIGLGYVGLPVAYHLSKKNHVVSFDINRERIGELKNGVDRTEEISTEEFILCKMTFSSNEDDLASCDFYIVAVPTPIDESKQPNLKPMISASQLVGKYLTKGNIVVYESTVYPGVCENVCKPILEKASGLKLNGEFFIGYSPERINPGDKEHSFTKIKKLISAENSEALDEIEKIYGSVVEAGVFRADSIQVAEAAKVIENVQRDINIALMNELSLIFDKIGIDTRAVLEAASTKWNFLKFYPGLVGGHCIGVDPYYLTHIAEKNDYHPQVILSGRRINDGVSKFIAEKTIKLLIGASCQVKGARVGIFGLTFKENCPDIRNSKVFDIIDELNEYGVNCLLHDPKVSHEELPKNYQERFCHINEMTNLDAVVLCVSHDEFAQVTPSNYLELMSSENGVFVDVKGVFSSSDFSSLGKNYWRL
jgi:UDP-N-acetyl-D-galactosamine dehydrogenase